MIRVNMPSPIIRRIFYLTKRLVTPCNIRLESPVRLDWTGFVLAAKEKNLIHPNAKLCWQIPKSEWFIMDCDRHALKLDSRTLAYQLSGTFLNSGSSFSHMVKI